MSTIDTMNGGAGGNPTTRENNTRSRYGGHLGTALRAYKAGQRIAAAEAAPSDPGRDCQALGQATKAELVVRTPAGVTDYTIHVGRWVTGERWQASGASVTAVELDGFVADETIEVTGSTTGELRTFTWETRGNLVGAYVTDIVGTVAANASFMYWFRGIGG